MDNDFLKQLNDTINQTFIQARIENIKEIRNLVILFITLSSVIIGFTIPEFSNTTLIKNSTLLIVGLFILLGVILYGFYYLKGILESENKNLKERHKKFVLRNIKIIDAMDKGNSEKSAQLIEESKNDSEEKQRSDRGLDILFLMFCLGLVFIILSMINLSMIVYSIIQKSQLESALWPDVEYRHKKIADRIP